MLPELDNQIKNKLEVKPNSSFKSGYLSTDFANPRAFGIGAKL
jgi:hypothetical protein